MPVRPENPSTNEVSIETSPRSGINLLTRSVIYEPRRDLIATVANSFNLSTFLPSNLSTFAYANDAAGRRSSITRTGAAFGALAGATDAYGYNGRSEVVSSRRTLGGGEVRDFDHDYAYDPIGNRTSATYYDEQGEAVASAYTANALNQYTSRTVPGNVQVRGEADTGAVVTVNENPAWRNGEYFYGGDYADNATFPVFHEVEIAAVVPASSPDGWDEMSAVTGRVFVAQTPEAFEYDADDGMHNAQCIMHNDCAVAVAGHQLPLSPTMGRGQLCIVHYALCIGEIVAHYDYSPFGETLIESGDLAASFTHRFSTKPWCPVTGLCEYQMRKYRPEIGRWLSRDPIGEENLKSLYQFCSNSFNSYDSRGLFAVTIGVSFDAGGSTGISISFAIGISYSRRKGLKWGIVMAPKNKNCKVKKRFFL